MPDEHNNAPVDGDYNTSPDDVVETRSNSIFQILGERIAATAIGQFVLRKMHRILYIAESTAKWGCTPKQKGTDSVGDYCPTCSKLERPLPWVFFLLALALLRLSRFTAGIVQRIRGKQNPEYVTIVTSLQGWRRNLRLWRFRGLKAKQAKLKKVQKSSSQSISIIELFPRFIIEFILNVPTVS